MVAAYLVFGLIVAWLSRVVRQALPEGWRGACAIKLYQDPPFCLPFHWLVFLVPGLIVGILGTMRRNRWMIFGGFSIFAWHSTEFLVALARYRKEHAG